MSHVQIIEADQKFTAYIRTPSGNVSIEYDGDGCITISEGIRNKIIYLRSIQREEEKNEE